MAALLADKYEARKAEVNERFEQLRANEEELNRIFAEIYNMVGEVPIEVEEQIRIGGAPSSTRRRRFPNRIRATSTCAPSATKSRAS